MNYDFNEDYQYDSCASRGICSVNPRTSSLQEVLVMYLKLTAYYALKLHENNKNDSDIKDIILDTISVLVSNPEFSETDFKALTGRFNEIIPRIIKEYEETCSEQNIIPECLKSVLKFTQETNIINSIRLGEKEFLNKVNSIPQEVRDLYKILFVLAKSMCINITDLESFGKNTDEAYITVLELLSSLNYEEQDIEKLKDFICKITKIDNNLMVELRSAQEERYGKQIQNEVSYTTVPGKAILVVGSNIRELEDILEAVKDEDIDVYTHDEMMLANTFPKFAEYKNLKGQYGHGMTSCLLDFSTFPGPIVLTQHSLYNVEHLYRGRLYTTDFATSKGVIPIKNNDFSDVIQAAKSSKGFKTGKQCESVDIGFDFDSFINLISQKLSASNYKKIVVIGLGGYTLEQQAYFEKFLKQVPDDILVVSLSFCQEKENVICLNVCFDTFAIVKVAEGIKNNFSQPLVIIFPECGRHTLSQIIYLLESNIQIYVGRCTPIILNPNLITTLSDVFGIKGLTSVKKDMEDIIK